MRSDFSLSSILGLGSGQSIGKSESIVGYTVLLFIGSSRIGGITILISIYFEVLYPGITKLLDTGSNKLHGG